MGLILKESFETEKTEGSLTVFAEKPKIKRLNLDAVAPGKAIDELTEAEREVVKNLLRMTFDNLK